MNNKISLFLTALVYFFGYSSIQASDEINQGPMPVVDYVNLERFMGDWYVIATIPTFFEKDASFSKNVGIVAMTYQSPINRSRLT